MRITEKQRILLDIIWKKNPDGSSIDMDQLVERAPYETTKDSMHFSIRALVKHGLVEKGPLERRRGRARRIIVLTALGEHWAALYSIPTPASTTKLEEVKMVAELDPCPATFPP